VRLPLLRAFLLVDAQEEKKGKREKKRGESVSAWERAGSFPLRLSSGMNFRAARKRDSPPETGASERDDAIRDEER
jgi:hypothetical protein